MEKAKHNFHLPLPEGLYQELRTEAKKAKKPATALAREAIENWINERKAEALHKSIAEYANAYAGTEFDLDKELEEASLETW